MIVATVVGSAWLSRKFKERYAQFPWWKVGLLIAVEVIAWIVFRWFWANPWIVAVAAVVIIIILLKRRKKQEQIL